jgi:L-amino acid N-acyltransferase YncA
MQIRAAEAADWAQIYPVFRAIVDAGDTYTYPEGLSGEEARSLWMEPPPSHCVVAIDGHDLLGTAKMGPNRPGRGSHVATASFMVNPSFRRSGAGRALGLHALDWARSAGYHGMQFNAVVESNVAAVRLWESLGFTIIGTVPEAFNHRTLGYVGLHVMYRQL